MRPISITICAMIWTLVAASAACAQQMIPPGTSQFSPPPPPPPPGPKIEVPAIPRMDAPPPQPGVRPSQRGSFSDRVTRCLDEGAAAGLGPNERAAYSRSCANQ
jgi:hypothetical protein